MGDASSARAVAVGDVYLCILDSVLVLKDVLYVPDFRQNLISVSKLNESGYSVIFDSGLSIMRNNKVLIHSVPKGSLYTITCMHKSSINVACKTSNKRKSISETDQTQLWHLRLGHINLNRIQRLVSSGILEQFKPTASRVCESCLEGKMSSKAFKAKGYRAEDVLGLIHSDLCGPMSTQARGGYEYFVTFIDDYSRYGDVYLLRRKSECFDKFKEFKAEVENKHGKRIKSLRSDRGG